MTSILLTWLTVENLLSQASSGFSKVLYNWKQTKKKDYSFKTQMHWNFANIWYFSNVTSSYHVSYMTPFERAMSQSHKGSYNCSQWFNCPCLINIKAPTLFNVRTAANLSTGFEELKKSCKTVMAGVNSLVVTLLNSVIALAASKITISALWRRQLSR